MKNYNKFLRNIAEMIEKGLFVSKDLKIEIENAIKFKAEEFVNKMNLVSREEFEIQKKLIEKLQKDLKKLNSNKKRSKKN
jgi:BMFP domain-containing protein YqiC